jgi:small-conductance mechanosensitive channel
MKSIKDVWLLCWPEDTTRMKPRQRLILAVLLIFLAAMVTGVLVTRRQAPPRARFGNRTRATQTKLVDQRPLETARALAALASTPGQRALANRALHTADDEVDLAFATALRDATEHPTPPDDETRMLLAHIEDVQQRVNADQELVKQLKEAVHGKHSYDPQDIELAEAQLLLDQEELADAKQDLGRSGRDVRSVIKRMLEEHEATHQSDQNLTVGTVQANEPSTLIARLRTWWALHGGAKRLSEAEQEAIAAAAVLTQSHNTLEAHIAQLRSAKPWEGLAAQQRGAALVASVRHQANDEKSLADFDKRIRDEQELSQIYRDWQKLVAMRQRRVLHGIFQSAMWIVLVCLAAFMLSILMGRFDSILSAERKRLRTLRRVVWFAVEAVAIVLILLLVFGAPGQMSTVLGLAGAGLTVALKDFIIAFFGWFVLMGKNGIRVGDWVEINGIGGEVVDIGLLRTVLLETGQWSDAGHPTGRKVAFVNSFAIEGHYFNFSTTGQWLWDELEIMVPAAEDPNPTVQAIRKLVTQETDANARLAEQEWQQVASGHALQSFSAAPAINVRPTNQGVNVMVRYITRAYERYELRSRLYAAIVELLRSRNIPATGNHLASGAAPA